MLHDNGSELVNNGGGNYDLLLEWTADEGDSGDFEFLTFTVHDAVETRWQPENIRTASFDAVEMAYGSVPLVAGDTVIIRVVQANSDKDPVDFFTATV